MGMEARTLQAHEFLYCLRLYQEWMRRRRCLWRRSRHILAHTDRPSPRQTSHLTVPLCACKLRMRQLPCRAWSPLAASLGRCQLWT